MEFTLTDSAGDPLTIAQVNDITVHLQCNNEVIQKYRLAAQPVGYEAVSPDPGVANKCFILVQADTTKDFHPGDVISAEILTDTPDNDFGSGYQYKTEANLFDVVETVID